MLAEKLGSGEPPEAVSRFWAVAPRGEDALASYYREKERKAALNLKIGDGWDEAPFPFEVSPEEREASTSEHVFSTEPWVRFDPGWRAEMPTIPGEIRFADDVWQECGEYFLVGPISPEEARHRRAEIQSYAFAKRLEDGALVVVRRYARLSEDIAAEARPNYYWGQYLRMEVSTGTSLSADFSPDYDCLENIRLGTLYIRDATNKELWHAVISEYSRDVSVWDHRGASHRSERKIDNDELTAVTLPIPGLDDYRPLLDCVTAFLMRNGYGALE